MRALTKPFTQLRFARPIALSSGQAWRQAGKMPCSSPNSLFTISTVAGSSLAGSLTGSGGWLVSVAIT